MYNTDNDKIPRQHLAASSRSAREQFQNWLTENDLQQIHDADGTPWKLTVKVLEKPSADDLHQAVFDAQLYMKADASADEFVKTGILNPESDERLIAMIGDARIPLQMKPVEFSAPNAEQLRLEFADRVGEVKKKLQSSSLATIKRQLIGRWIDERAVFGFSIKNHNNFDDLTKPR
jgi:hypothetical protein